MKDQSIQSFAGLCDVWKDRNSEKEIHSYRIITATPNEIVDQYHDRMPVILQPNDEVENSALFISLYLIRQL